ncbi:MAG TPA: hypothetical protein VKY54_15825 [Kiloniellales bacterium]|nr:hypothetical protein [Kiloniellales bacterium]
MNAAQRNALLAALKRVRWPETRIQAMVNEAYVVGFSQSARLAGQISLETSHRIADLLSSARKHGGACA